MGGNYLDGKYDIFLLLFVSFRGDIESKWAIREPNKKCPVDKYNEESIGIALCLL